LGADKAIGAGGAIVLVAQMADTIYWALPPSRNEGCPQRCLARKRAGCCARKSLPGQHWISMLPIRC
jgi:hypothetical protein